MSWKLALASAAAVLCSTASHGTEPGCPGSIQWDGGAGTSAWTTFNNWSSDAMPGASDDVCIPDLVAGVEVVHSSGTHAIHSLAGPGGLQVSGGTLSFAVSSPGLGQLTLSGGTLSGTGDLPVTSAFAWSGGTMGGSGTTSVPGGSLSGGTKALTGGRVLETSGNTTWTGIGLVRLDGGAVVENGGVWDAQGNAAVTRLDEASGFHNLPGATFKKTAGGGTTAVAVPLENEGTVSVQNGTLSLAGGSSTTGALQGSSGTTLQFDGGDHTVATGASLAVPTVIVTSGNLSLDGSYNVNTSTFSGGTVTFHPAATLTNLGALSISGSADLDLSSGETVTVPSVSLLGGRLRGTDTMSVNGTLAWSAGEISGPGILTTRLDVSGPATKDLTGARLLRLTGGLLLGGGHLRLGGGAAIEVVTGVTLSVNDGLLHPGVFVENLGGAAGFRVLASGSLDAIWPDHHVLQVPFTNNGIVRLGYPTLSLEGGGSATGRFEQSLISSEDATLHFGGGTFALQPGSFVSLPNVEVTAGDVTVDGAYGANTTRVSGGTLTFHPAANLSFIGETLLMNPGTLHLDSGEPVSPPSLTQTGGVLSGSDLVSVMGPAIWNGGTMTGGGTTETLSALTLNGVGAADLAAGRILRTAGVTTWSGLGPIRLTGGGRIVNEGEWKVASDAALVNLGGAGAFANGPGAVFKKEGGGDSEVGVPFVNAGTVEASVATLRFTGGYLQTGGATVLDGGALASTNTIAIQGGTLGGEGTLTANVLSSGSTAPGLSPGLLTIDGAYTQASGGSLEIEIGGLAVGTEHDRLEVVGAATLAGGLSVSLLDDFVPQDGNTFTVLTAAEVHGSFSTRSLPPLPAGLGWSVLVQPMAVVLAVSPDSDGDGVGDIGDCAPADPSLSDAPGEVAGVAFGADKETLSWTSQAALFDAVRGLTSALPVGGGGETCLLSGSGTPQVVDPDLPEAGACFYYLVRATNACGAGSYGTSAGGAPRTTGACP